VGPGRGGAKLPPVRALFAEFVLDTQRRELSRGGSPVHLRPKALSLLECLVEQRHGAVAKDVLMERLWPSTFVTDASLTSLVKELRDALDDRAEAPRFVRGVRGYGYAFCAEVRTEPPAAAPRPAVGREFRLAWQACEIALAPGENLLGRTHEAMVWVDDPSVSRQHAVIRVDSERATIEDCGSCNGTWIRGERIRGPRELQQADEVWLGKARLVVRIHSANAPTVPMDEGPPAR
jgi:DNA-binding winged helix-turn-helix (wHTH) protein